MIIAPLTPTINQTITFVFFLDRLKIAKIKRSISLLPVIYKLLENVIHRLLLYYFTETNLLSKQQHGLRPKHSTEHAALHFPDTIHY